MSSKLKIKMYDEESQPFAAGSVELIEPNGDIKKDKVGSSGEASFSVSTVDADYTLRAVTPSND